MMKTLLYLGAVLALLRSVAARLPNNDYRHDAHDQKVFQPANAANKGAKVSVISAELVENEIPASRFGADAPSDHDVASSSPGSEHVQSLDDIDVAAPQPPQNPKFTVGSTTSRQWAITYTPYTDNLTCLSPTVMRSDVAAIARKGFTSIRLYSIDCSALRHIGQAALAHNLKLIIGIQLDDGLEDASTQISELISWASAPPTPNPANHPNKWSLIELVVIGNEAIFNSHLTPSALATFITTTRQTLRQSSYPGPITTTEPLSILTQHSSLLCPVLDLSAATIHPFVHPSVPAPHAGSYVSAELYSLSLLCPNLAHQDPIALETGWPSRGRANGDAVPGYLEQWVAVSGIVEKVGGRSVLLGWEDQGWRDEGEFGVEGSWGCGHVFR